MKNLVERLRRPARWTAVTVLSDGREYEDFADTPRLAADEINRLRQICRDNGVSEDVIMGANK